MANPKTTPIPEPKRDPTHRDESKVSNRDKGAPPDSRKSGNKR